MSGGDYKSCDVCGGKAFYDADLSYDDASDEWPAFRMVGSEQYDTLELRQKYGTCLGYVGDWAVICTDCSPKFKTLIVPIDTPTPRPEATHD